MRALSIAIMFSVNPHQKYNSIPTYKCLEINANEQRKSPPRPMTQRVTWHWYIGSRHNIMTYNAFIELYFRNISNRVDRRADRFKICHHCSQYAIL